MLRVSAAFEFDFIATVITVVRGTKNVVENHTGLFPIKWKDFSCLFSTRPGKGVLHSDMEVGFLGALYRNALKTHIFSQDYLPFSVDFDITSTYQTVRNLPRYFLHSLLYSLR